MSKVRVWASMPGYSARPAGWGVPALGLVVLLVCTVWGPLRTVTPPVAFAELPGAGSRGAGAATSWLATVLGVETAMLVVLLSLRGALPLTARAGLLACGAFVLLMFTALPLRGHPLLNLHSLWLLWAGTWLMSCALGAALLVLWRRRRWMSRGQALALRPSPPG